MILSIIQPAFDQSRLKRLIILENSLRQSSIGDIMIKEYQALLAQAGMKVPSRQTLNEDFSRYANLCDDLDYGAHTKGLKIQPHIDDDAISWGLGTSWLDSPLRPKLSSSQLRCFLLAQQQQVEVAFEYRALPKENQVWQPNKLKGIPIKFLFGADSVYLQIWRKNGWRTNLNLTRVAHPVIITGNNSQDYQTIEQELTVEIFLLVENVWQRERLLAQFRCLKQDPLQEKRLYLLSPKSLALMTMEILEFYLKRTTIPPNKKRQLDQIKPFSVGGIDISWRFL